MINNKNKIDQETQTVQLSVAKSVAQANKDIAEARGDSASNVIRAAGEARANLLRQNSLTENLLKQQWIDAWKAGGSLVPGTIIGSGSERFILNTK